MIDRTRERTMPVEGNFRIDVDSATVVTFGITPSPDWPKGWRLPDKNLEVHMVAGDTVEITNAPWKTTITYSVTLTWWEWIQEQLDRARVGL